MFKLSCAALARSETETSELKTHVALHSSAEVGLVLVCAALVRAGNRAKHCDGLAYKANFTRYSFGKVKLSKETWSIFRGCGNSDDAYNSLQFQSF